MFRNQSAPNQYLWTLAIPALVILVLLGFAAKPAFAQDFNFGTIDDPLNGDYELFTVDDLVVARTNPENNNTTSSALNYILETENYTISSQSILDADNPPCWMTSGPQPQQTRIGRFFAYSYDVMVTLVAYGVTATGGGCTAPAGQPNMALHIQSTQNGANTATPFTMSASNTAVAMDDFNQDGFEDLFIMSDAEVLVATANDVTDSNQGMSFGPKTALPSSNYAAISDPATGDFNKDELEDVAWIAKDQTVHFATVCPGDVAGTVCAGAAPGQVILDPLQSRATVISTPIQPAQCFASAFGRSGVALTAGDFAGDGSDDLLTANLAGSSFNCYNYAYWWEFDGNFSVVGGKANANILVEAGNYLDVYAAAASLDWFGGSVQAVLSGGRTVGSTDCWQRVESVIVITFDSNTNTMASESTSNIDPTCMDPGANYPQLPWMNGMAVGRFASIPDNPNTETDFNLQIATLLNNGTVHIYKVSAPTNYKPALASTTTLEAGLGLNLRPTTGPTNQSPFNWLVSGDLQGRSGRLGPPTIVRVNNHSQPSVILGAPPMHLDYILPDPSTTTETQIVNFTAAPDSYNSAYAVSESTTTQSSDTNTSSYSFAYSESAEEKFKLKIPVIPEIQGSFKQAWEQKGENTTSNYSFTQGEFSFNASTTTGFSDEIWYSTNDFNVYFYPVLGQTVTVTDTVGGTSEQPLYVSFSGPSDSTQMTPVAGASVEWYQPVHEPGQIFSYPWSSQQLAERESGLSLLTSANPEAFFTDDSGTTQTLNWSQSSGADQTTGSSHTHSFETDNSISIGGIPDEGSGLELTGSFDYNNSTATSTLNQSSTTVGESTGITIDKPKFPAAYGSLYQYIVRPFIFGQTPNPGVVQDLSLGTDIATTGPLRTAYVANPKDPQSGSWWSSDVSPYTQSIDVALNHPQRWNFTFGYTGSGLACMANDCATPAQPLPGDLWNSQFYHMRGLFITLGGASGPQRTQATVGDDVFLQAWVYNYSLKDMPAGSTIHTRFYRQEIDNTTATGDSVLINEVVTDPLPGFNSDAAPDAPNWTTVMTSFEATSDMADTNFIFWVVVWAEDAEGAMIGELPGHGLTELPGTLATIGDVPLETVSITTAFGDQEQTSFTNNVGMFKQKFYIAPAPVPGAQTPAPGVPVVENAQAMAAPQLGSAMYLVSADIRAAGGPVEGTEVLLYDGDPADRKSRVLDVDVLPFIAAGEIDVFSVNFAADHCGTNRLVIVARSSATNRTQQTLTFDVSPCPPIYLPIILNRGTLP